MSDVGATGVRDQVRDAYSRAAAVPGNRHPFPVGRRFAEEVGYPASLLAEMPEASIDGFCGTSNVAVSADIPPGVAVLDLGCGAGLDSLVAARRVGPSGKVTGIDFSDEMLHRARESAAMTGADNVVFQIGSAEEVPLANASIDVALVNGIFNLNPARSQILAELARVVRPGGRVHAAEIIHRNVPRPFRGLLRFFIRLQSKPDDWFA